MSEETNAVEVVEENEADKKVRVLTQQEKDYWLAVYSGLCGSQRFTDFVKANYEIQNIVDHEKKSYEIRVIEKPVAVGPKMAPTQVFKLQEILIGFGVKNTVDCVKNILKLLGQESSPIITSESSLIGLDKKKIKLD